MADKATITMVAQAMKKGAGNRVSIEDARVAARELVEYIERSIADGYRVGRLSPKGSLTEFDASAGNFWNRVSACITLGRNMLVAIKGDHWITFGQPEE